MKTCTALLAIAFTCSIICHTPAAEALLPVKPGDAYFAQLDPKPAPQPSGLMLQKGDRLAICGDSITEQKMYSRIMETYLTVCVPQLEVTTRQYGWGGETAQGFWRRMSNDCLRFKPTIATTCYGMNDHGYRPYDEKIGTAYRSNQLGVVNLFLSNGVRVVLGSPGCVGRNKNWNEASVMAKNINLCALRNIDIEIATQKKIGFADVFWPMFVWSQEAQQHYGTDFALPGSDGVHPNWAGHTAMAYSFLRALGLDGAIGTFTVDLGAGTATASEGHEIVATKTGEVQIKSKRYPFCVAGATNKDDSIRSAMTFIPFHQELNRLLLIAKNASARKYKVTWGASSRSYTAEELQKGVNLAADFAENPFLEAFKKVDAAVAAKQGYETKQIKEIFHDLVNGKFKTVDEIRDSELEKLFALRSAEGKFNRDQIADATEQTRAPLVEAVKSAFVPVTHTIKIEAE
jgi:lysophospholipase L1-like esterase